MTLKFNGLEASFYYDSNLMVKKGWMSVKLKLRTIHEGVMCMKRLNWLQRRPHDKKKIRMEKWVFLKWGIF